VDVEDAAVVDRAAVRDPDDPSGRDDDLRLLDDRPRDAEQGVLLEDRVRVDRAHVGIARRVHRRVQRVGLAAVRLVDHPEVAVAAGDVCASDGGRRQQGTQSLPDGNEIEGRLEPLEGAVGRAVVHDDHLVLRIPEGEQRVDIGDDRGLLVVRRDEYRDRRRHRRGEDLVVRRVPARAEVADESAPGDSREPEVDDVQGGEVRERERRERDREIVEDAHARRRSAASWR
jgi:hypothetical protein